MTNDHRLSHEAGSPQTHLWEYDMPCHFNELQADGSLLVRLPKLGDMNTHGFVVWLCVEAGDWVEAHQALAEVDCTKLCVEIFSPCEAQVLQVLISKEQEIPIGEPMFVLAPKARFVE